jgi:hypothetical protein
MKAEASFYSAQGHFYIPKLPSVLKNVPLLSCTKKSKVITPSSWSPFYITKLPLVHTLTSYL